MLTPPTVTITTATSTSHLNEDSRNTATSPTTVAAQLSSSSLASNESFLTAPSSDFSSSVSTEKKNLIICTHKNNSSLLLTTCNSSPPIKKNEATSFEDNEFFAQQQQQQEQSSLASFTCTKHQTSNLQQQETHRIRQVEAATTIFSNTCDKIPPCIMNSQDTNSCNDTGRSSSSSVCYRTKKTSLVTTLEATLTSSINNSSSLGRTQSGPVIDSSTTTLHVDEEDPSSSATSSLHESPKQQRCEHCLTVDRNRAKAKTLLKRLIASCQELIDVIHSRFRADACVCYPNYIDDADLDESDGLFPLHISSSLYLEFLQHLLRLVRPGASEHEQRAPNSRLVRHTGTSKVLVPVTIQRDTGSIVQLGFPSCFLVPEGCNKGCFSYGQHPRFRILEIVVDYEPPTELATALLLKPSISPRWPFPHRLSHDFRSDTEMFPVTSIPTVNKPSITITPSYSSPLVIPEERVQAESTASRTNITVGPPLPKSASFLGSKEESYRPKRRSIMVNLGHYETLVLASPLDNINQNRRSATEGRIRLSAGHFSTRGRRQRQEDRVVTSEDLHKTCGFPPLPHDEKVTFLAIYDGHGGTEAVDYVASRLHHTLCSNSSYAEGDIAKALYEAFEATEEQVASRLTYLCRLNRQYRKQLKRCGLLRSNSATMAMSDAVGRVAPSASIELSPREEEILGSNSSNPINISDNRDILMEKILCLEHKIAELELEIGTLPEESDITERDENNNDEPVLTSGCTALVIVIKGSQLFVANLGDSRCILSRNGRIACLTEDHRLRSSARESERVRKTPGTFSYDGYLCGQLGVSRAFGNIQRQAEKKLLGLSSCPDVIRLDLRNDDEFLIAGCDGVFDTVAATDAAYSVASTLRSSKDPALACKELVELAIINHADDNVCAIVVCFNHLGVEEGSTLLSRVPPRSLTSAMSATALLPMTKSTLGTSDLDFAAISSALRLHNRSWGGLREEDPLEKAYSMGCYSRRRRSVACCSQCTCANVKHENASHIKKKLDSSLPSEKAGLNEGTKTTDDDEPISPATILRGNNASSATSARRPYTRKKYYWNVVQTP